MAAHCRLGFEPGNKFGLRVVWRMHTEMRQVEEERVILVPRDEVDGLVGEKVCQVLPLGVVGLRTCREIEMLAHADDGLIEASLTGMVVALLANVPLAEH